VAYALSDKMEIIDLTCMTLKVTDNQYGQLSERLVGFLLFYLRLIWCGVIGISLG